MTTPTVDLDTITLKAGAHSNAQAGMCLLEAVSFIAGEPFSDHPLCVDPVIAAYGRRLNDRMPDADRQRLVPFIPTIMGTAGDGKTEARRNMLVDFAIRVATPRWLDAAGRADDAARLRQLEPITGHHSRAEALHAIRSIRDTLWDIRRAYRQAIRDAVQAEYAKHPTGDPDAVAVADAVADAAAAADWGKTYDQVYDQVLPIFRAKYDENPAYREAREANLTDGINILGRLATI